MKTSEIVLTRYLYIKIMVIDTLHNSIETGNYDSAIFWAYELYYSGFEDQVIEYLMAMLDYKYKHHIKLCNYIRKKQEENTPTFVATILKNMQIKNHENQETLKPRFITVTDEQIEKYKTVEPEKHIWKYLRKVCETPVAPIKMSKKAEDKLLEIYRYKWLFYASRSPIWKDRIVKYNGIIDCSKKTVEFINDDDLEAFYDKYGYEPDEQPLNIQRNCIGIQEIVR